MRQALLALVLVLLTALGAVSPASAAVEDAFSLGPAVAAWRAQGVRLVAVPPAAITGPAWTLPVQRRSRTTIFHSGGVLLRRRGGRTLVVTGLRTPSTRGGPVTALVAGRRIVIARVSASNSVTLSAAFNSVVRRRLALRTRVTTAFGVLRRAPVGTAKPVPPTPAAPAAPGTPTPSPAATGGPTPLARPVSAKDVTAATLTWHIRDRLVQYLADGEGTSPLDGAVAAAPSGTPALVREYNLPLRDGWYDPTSGQAAVRFTGGVKFSWAARQLDIEAHDLEAELTPGASRVIARFAGAAVVHPGRAPLANLTWALPVAASGAATWAKIPGTVPSEAGTDVFAGFYFPGDEFGWFGLTLTYAP